MPSHRYTTTGCDTELVVPPMTEARRQQVFGKLLPMERPLADEGHGYDHLPIWQEQPPIWLGTLLLGSGVVIIAAFVLLVAEVIR